MSLKQFWNSSEHMGSFQIQVRAFQYLLSPPEMDMLVKFTINL
jgi:hypothetical protein